MIFLMGRSASGKDTVVKELVKNFGFKKLVTTTTRPAREGEKDGVDYHFLTENQFHTMKDLGLFAESREYHTSNGVWYYGSRLNDIENADDKTIAILTPKGIRDVLPKLSERPIIIYLYSNLATVEKRLAMRGDDQVEAKRRIEADINDFKGVEYMADKIVYNNEGDDINDICCKINNFVKGVYDEI